MRRNKKLNNLTIALIRCGLGLESSIGELAHLKEGDWDKLLEFSSFHGVTGVVLDGIVACSAVDLIPKVVKLKWIAAIDAMERHYSRQRAIIVKMARFYHEHGIDLMILKGYGLSLLYPHPEHRPCGDVDIWLFGRQKSGDAAMNAEWGTKVDWSHHHHTVFHVDGVMVENHFDFVNVHAHLSNRIIERRLRMYASKDSCQEVVIDGESVLLPCADFNALFLLHHAAGHFAASKIGLRHVLDWALFLKYHAAEVDWDALQSFAVKMNMHHFLYSLNSICMNVLGIEPSVTIPVGDNDTTLQNRVLNDILSPEFSCEAPHGAGLVKSLSWKYRRWKANEWKHHLVYRESMFTTFWVQAWCHLLRPRSLKS